ncbi:hypothetical protein [Magnetofaba australis]|uniref:Uncharacterized protein n=1 Tax=Magnetofaba australis IT-1 TaxID=1434232 RepID=A0A1Y2KA73_9PROT|nr:hypothetical protein [Magnetofaba australis]OSM08671.1 hypothetical protein MAIT1_02843 [Magnetofaba australis IT-1]
MAGKTFGNAMRNPSNADLMAGVLSGLHDDSVEQRVEEGSQHAPMETLSAAAPAPVAQTAPKAPAKAKSAATQTPTEAMVATNIKIPERLRWALDDLVIAEKRRGNRAASMNEFVTTCLEKELPKLLKQYGLGG